MALHLAAARVRAIALDSTQGLLGRVSLRRHWSWQTIVLTEFIHNAVAEFEGVAVFAGIGERSREGLELWNEMQRRGVLERTALVFGQMKEIRGARLMVGEAALSMAEYFRDDLELDVMFVVDKLYRHVQAGMR